MEKENFEKHESFAIAGFNRVQHGGHKNWLFGSSIEHPNSIILSIKRAEKKRDLSRDWFHGTEELIEIEMSESQFGQLISSLNIGEGIPVTLRRYNGKMMSDCPANENRRAQFSAEYKQLIERVFKDLDRLSALAESFQSKPNITKGDRKSFLDIASGIRIQIVNNLTFINDSFNEQMDRSVREANSEVEAFVDNRLRSMGLDALKEKFSIKLLESEKEDK